MMGRSDSERISMIRLVVLMQSMRVTDRQTDGRNCRGIYTRHSILSRVRRKETENWTSRMQNKSSLKVETI